MFPFKTNYGWKSLVNKTKAGEIIEKYLKPTYQNSSNLHIVDAYPSIGTFSQSINEILKPKRHFLLEPHASYYKWLSSQDWTKNSGVNLSKNDPFRWSTFSELEEEHRLPDHDRSSIHPDLLFIANLTSLQGEQLCCQYLNCITNGSWLLKHGRVKLLLWVREPTAIKVLAPKSSKERSRVSVQRESCCDGNILSADLNLDKNDLFPARNTQIPVLIELNPFKEQIPNLDSFEYVIKMLFILRNQPLTESLEVLGPGASTDLIEKLPQKLIKTKPINMTVEEFELVAKAFNEWPFKPMFLYDFYDKDNVNSA